MREIVLLGIILLTVLYSFGAALFNDEKNTNIKNFLKQVKITESEPLQKNHEEYPLWENLRTTYVPGVFCQQIADDGTYKKQKHYFYNTKTEEMILIPNVYYISDPRQMGDLYEEYEKYGAKSNIITFRGKKYKVYEYNPKPNSPYIERKDK